MVNEQLSDVLSEFARTMMTEFPIQEILDHLVRRIVDILPVTAAGVTLITPGSDPRYIAASSGTALGFEQLQTELDEGPCLVAYRTGTAVSVPDLCSDDRFPRFTPRALEAGMRAVFTFPLAHGRVTRLGALDLYRETPGELSADVMSAAQTLADVAAAYLLNARARADLEASSDRSRKAALHDPLTGLPNRTLLLERIRHASLRWRRSQLTSAVLFVDIDGFKSINDTHGHRIGDEALIAIAERLPRVMRPGDTLARISGDEFVLFCEDLAEPTEAHKLEERVKAAFARPFVLSTLELDLTASIGVALAGSGSTTPEEVLHAADLAMYAKKRGARHRDDEVDLRALHRADYPVDLEDALRGAADRGELSLEYQPIVSTAAARIVGIEALLRWHHPERGLVPTVLLIELAERTGLIFEIGRWVLERSQAERREWHDPHGEPLMLSVNVSASQLTADGFADSVAATLAKAPTDPALLTLEITESVLALDSGRTLHALRELKNLGVRIALDDFGTGYSSLSRLRSYPFDTLKVDPEFVADLGRDPASGTIVSAVLGLAHSLGLQVVAEGVETAVQRDQLVAFECDYCQGFYFARPMSASGVGQLIRDSGDGLPGEPVAA